MGRRFFLSALILAVSILPVCAERGSLTVAVSANLASVIPEINSVFEDGRQGVKLYTSIGSSGALSAQILNGAPFDVFLSADMNFPEKIDLLGGAAKPPQLYALGILVLVSRVENIYSTAAEFILNSTGPVIIPNPRVAPYGKAALEFLKAAGLYDAVEPRIAFTENIAQTVGMIISSDGIGFISKSALLSLKKKEKKSTSYTWFEIDPSLYSLIRQGLIITTHGKGNPWAMIYLDFIIHGEGRSLLASSGYQIPSK